MNMFGKETVSVLVFINLCTSRKIWQHLGFQTPTVIDATHRCPRGYTTIFDNTILLFKPYKPNGLVTYKVSNNSTENYPLENTLENDTSLTEMVDSPNVHNDTSSAQNLPKRITKHKTNRIKHCQFKFHTIGSLSVHFSPPGNYLSNRTPLNLKLKDEGIRYRHLHGYIMPPPKLAPLQTKDAEADPCQHSSNCQTTGWLTINYDLNDSNFKPFNITLSLVTQVDMYLCDAPAFFLCKRSNICISHNQRCDGTNDCGFLDQSDESDCPSDVNQEQTSKAKQVYQPRPTLQTTGLVELHSAWQSKSTMIGVSILLIVLSAAIASVCAIFVKRIRQRPVPPERGRLTIPRPQLCMLLSQMGPPPAYAENNEDAECPPIVEPPPLYHFPTETAGHTFFTQMSSRLLGVPTYDARPTGSPPSYEHISHNDSSASKNCVCDTQNVLNLDNECDDRLSNTDYSCVSLIDYNNCYTDEHLRNGDYQSEGHTLYSHNNRNDS